MRYIALLLPALFAALFVYALCKKVRLYDCFTEGVKGALPLAMSLFPYLAAVLILSELFEQSGLSDALTSLISPALSLVGVPPELARLILIKPFSGSGATAVLSDLLAVYGADSYVGRCACVAFGSSETVFYISAVYFAGSRRIRARPVVIALAANFAGVVLGCFLCRFL